MTFRALDGFEEISSKPISTLSLIQAARRSFQLIEPWSEAKSDNYQVQQIIDSIQTEASSYYKSIDESLKTAQAGYSLAKDAEALCDCLMAPKGTYDVKEIQEYIDDMRKVAQKAYDNAKKTVDSFRSNRQNFFEITKNVKRTIKSVEAEKKIHDSETVAAQRRAATCSGVAMAATQLSLAAVGAILTVSSLPAAFIVLPVVLPLVALGAGVAAHKNEETAWKRETRSQDCTTALQQLGSTDEHLGELVLQLDTFVAHWSRVDATLEAIRNRVKELQADNANKIRIKGIKKNWIEVGEKYMEYRIGMTRLQDFFPQPRVSN